MKISPCPSPRYWARLLLLLHLTSLLGAEAPAIRPSQPASLRLEISAGEIRLPDGSLLRVIPSLLEIAPPDFRILESVKQSGPALAPVNFADNFKNWEPWPGGSPRNPSLISLTPRYDDANTLILGHLYRHWRPETLRVRGADGEWKKAGEDFEFNPDWGQIANREERLGVPGKDEVFASIEIALPRLDLLQVDRQGVVSVKQGESRLVCPALPSADPQHFPLAGIYVAPWRSQVNPHHRENPAAVKDASEYAVTATEIFPLRDSPPVRPVNPAALAGTAAKLAAGEKVTLAFLGDSITLGAEAGAWFDAEIAYTARDLTFRGRLVHALRQRFPQAEIQPVDASHGGMAVKQAMELMMEKVLPAQPDLVIIAFGANDVDSSVVGPPKTSPEDFKAEMLKLVDAAREGGAEVLLVSAFPLHPWMKNRMLDRQPEYNRTLEDIAKTQKAALAPVFEAFAQLPDRGMPVYNTLHNWKNHPDDLGHRLYADTLLQVLLEAGDQEPRVKSEDDEIRDQ